VTARAVSNSRRLYFFKGTSGIVPVTNSINLPYDETYPYRNVRYFGENASGEAEYLIAYLGNVGGTSNTVVVLKLRERDL
jgi:hypothetical protein